MWEPKCAPRSGNRARRCECAENIDFVGSLLSAEAMIVTLCHFGCRTPKARRCRNDTDGIRGRALVGFCAPVRAEALPLIEGLPATYTPGEQFSFTLRVPELPDLTDYTLELVFSADGLHPSLIAFPTVAPPGSYVFPSSANFQFVLSTVLDSNEVRLTLADSIGPPGVLTTPGQNDTLGDDHGRPRRRPDRADHAFDRERHAVQLRHGGGCVRDAAARGDRAGRARGRQSGPRAPPGVALLGIGGLVLGLRGRVLRRTA